MEMAKVRIKNENLRMFTVGYLQVGEYCVDKGLCYVMAGRLNDAFRNMEIVSFFFYVQCVL
jgi:hypothetical protein